MTGDVEGFPSSSGCMRRPAGDLPYLGPTDERGELRLSTRGRHVRSLRAGKAGVGVTEHDLDLFDPGHDLEIELWLEPRLVTHGRIFTTSGEPLPFARVGARTVATERTAPPVEADAAGEFALVGLSPGRYSFSATGLTEPTTFLAGDDLEVVVDGLFLLVRCEGLRGQPLESVRVQLSAAGPSGVSGAHGVTRESGAILLGPIEPGEHVLGVGLRPVSQRKFPLVLGRRGSVERVTVVIDPDLDRQLVRAASLDRE